MENYNIAKEIEKYTEHFGGKLFQQGCCAAAHSTSVFCTLKSPYEGVFTNRVNLE